MADKQPTPNSPSPSPSPSPLRQPIRYNRRKYFAPALTLLFGGLLYVYSRVTVSAAKENAARSRRADGGSINWRNENARRHGVLARPEEQTLLQAVLGRNGGKGGDAGGGQGERTRGEGNVIEEGIKRGRG